MAVSSGSAGVCSGFVTAILQTKLGVDSLLSGIIVNTGLYSINIAIMGGSSLLNMNKVDTVFSLMKEALRGTVLAKQYKLAVALIARFTHGYIHGIVASLVEGLRASFPLPFRSEAAPAA